MFSPTEDIQFGAGTLVVLARLLVGKSLVTGSFSEKVRHAEAAAYLADITGAAFAFIERKIASRHQWPKPLAEAASPEFQLTEIDIDLAIAHCRTSIIEVVDAISSCSHPIYTHLGTIKRILSEVLDSTESYGFAKGHVSREIRVLLDTLALYRENRPTKALSGPREMGLDPIYAAGRSVLEEVQTVAFAEGRLQTRYLWEHAAREASASALCALSVIEYNGMPFDFYRDLIQQTADEARHAHVFLTLAKSAAQREGFQSPGIQSASGGGGDTVRFLLPRELAFYTAYLNSSLSQRLFMMNIETEAAGLGGYASRIKEARASGEFELASVLEIDRMDEQFHARLGAKWLRKLFPNRDDREMERASARLLRGFMLMTAVADGSGAALRDTIEKFAGGQRGQF